MFSRNHDLARSICPVQIPFQPFLVQNIFCGTFWVAHYCMLSSWSINAMYVTMQCKVMSITLGGVLLLDLNVCAGICFRGKNKLTYILEV